MSNIIFEVRARDPKIKDHYNGWNDIYKVTVEKYLLDSIASELYDKLFEHFSLIRKRVKRMDWSLLNNVQCHEYMIDCNSYNTLIEMFEKQYPEIDFRMFNSYQTSLSVSNFLFDEYNIEQRLRKFIKKEKVMD